MAIKTSEKMFPYKHKVHHDPILFPVIRSVLFILSKTKGDFAMSFQTVSMEFKMEVMFLIFIIYSLMK